MAKMQQLKRGLFEEERQRQKQKQVGKGTQL
jgi:hypothetical protein